MRTSIAASCLTGLLLRTGRAAAGGLCHEERKAQARDEASRIMDLITDDETAQSGSRMHANAQRPDIPSSSAGCAQPVTHSRPNPDYVDD